MPVKVMIISAFAGEAAAWLTNRGLRQLVPVPGLSADYPAVACNDAAVCHVTTGMGHANAAASMIALLLSTKFDFKRTYFLIAGIAGVYPRQATIGSAAWARYIVDIGIINEFDAREMPAGWATGFFRHAHPWPGRKAAGISL